MGATRKKTLSRARQIGRSRLTVKGQATIPMVVRKMLSLKAGDVVLFEESAQGSISIRRAEPLDLEFLQALEGTLSEWNSAHDDDAYRDL